MDEFNFNGTNPEYTAINDNVAIIENQLLTENQPIGENDAVPESTEKPAPVQTNKSKRQTAITGLVGSLVTVISAAVFGITTLLNVKMNAEFAEVAFVDGAINYEIQVADMTEKETLNLYLYDGEELVEGYPVPVIDEDNDGTVSGTIIIPQEEIQEKIDNGGEAKYRLSLKGNVGLTVERSFDSYVLKATLVNSHFDDVEGHCQCAVDGYYYFTMNFSDDNQVFTDFSAYIEDEFGNRADCVFNDDLHSEQRVFINNLKGAKAKLYINYCKDGEPTVKVIDITI
ncbi:MAG: hypothetical protein IJR66_01745 [Clostridia bacterium]|nr:hypothetical protein [Clostridia bacterium]